ncbi:hypothetical protein [Methanolobus chelungpuianus]|uniref:Uncharacterized protein n=1 Tax=Methanolobus chelungpuianus TaxID=502115 RepID=A0AAE3KYQ1_9EURY|nr:hypothetical protein [Methanolobus chelungpuianus]MCQ6962303.1 hypothetical protein [Methanolobus chelungpuianus]
MKYKKNYKLTLISIILISMLCITTVYAISEARKTVVIDPQSEYGKNLTDIAEKAIGDEGIDTKYVHLTTIYYETKDNIMIKFEGAKRYSNGVVTLMLTLVKMKQLRFLQQTLIDMIFTPTMCNRRMEEYMIKML